MDVTTTAHLAAAMGRAACYLGEVLDAGVDPRAVPVLIGRSERAPATLLATDLDVVEDVVLAAGARLAGIDPDVAGLLEVWGEPLRTVVADVESEFRRLASAPPAEI